MGSWRELRSPDPRQLPFGGGAVPSRAAAAPRASPDVGPQLRGTRDQPTAVVEVAVLAMPHIAIHRAV